jgi:hypothetical protein
MEWEMGCFEPCSSITNSCPYTASYADGQTFDACRPDRARSPSTVTTEKLNWPIAGCQDNYFQNGDLDFGGNPCIHHWPDGSANHPTSFAYIGPFAHGRSYPKIQFGTDIAGSEADCNVAAGAGCTAKPLGAKFCAFWSPGRSQYLGCPRNFGDDIPGRTVADFGGDAPHGSPGVARYGGTLTSPVLANPQTRRWC